MGPRRCDDPVLGFGGEGGSLGNALHGGVSSTGGSGGSGMDRRSGRSTQGSWSISSSPGHPWW
jgi:hypothetical protein